MVLVRVAVKNKKGISLTKTAVVTVTKAIIALTAPWEVPRYRCYLLQNEQYYSLQWSRLITTFCSQLQILWNTVRNT